LLTTAIQLSGSAYAVASASGTFTIDTSLITSSALRRSVFLRLEPQTFFLRP
jgi:hypothetical protein